jgi:hypothetical protein
MERVIPFAAAFAAFALAIIWGALTAQPASAHWEM